MRFGSARFMIKLVWTRELAPYPNKSAYVLAPAKQAGQFMGRKLKKGTCSKKKGHTILHATAMKKYICVGYYQTKEIIIKPDEIMSKRKVVHMFSHAIHASRTYHKY